MFEHIQLPAGRIGHLWFHRPLGQLHHWHHHDPPEFNLVLRGRGTYLLADRRYELEPGCLVWLFPGQEHRLVDMSPDFMQWIAVIDADCMRAAAGPDCPLLERDPAGQFTRRLAPADRELLDTICADLCEAEDARFNAGLPYCFLTAWRVFQRAEAAAMQRLHPAIDASLRLLDRDPELDADTLAAAVGLSRSHYCRLFSSQIGHSLTAYRTNLRLERVRKALAADPDRALLPLALEAGFGSYAQFHRAVRATCGCAPRDLVHGSRLQARPD